MNSFIDFILLKDPNVGLVVLGSTLFGIVAAIVACFTFLRKRALLGDAISHALLPGICMAFIIAQSKSIWVLTLGAFISGLLSLLFIEFIVNRTKLKNDTALSLTLSVFFGAGVLLLSFIQNKGMENQAGLDKYIFGNAASMVQDDIYGFAIVVVILLTLVFLFYKEFKLVLFDRDFAVSIGLPVKTIELLLTFSTVLTIALGIQSVGIVLVAAMLIAPAAAARYWTNSFKLMLFAASIVAVLSCISGAYISYIQPSMPTGPWIIVVATALTIFSILLAPKKGVVYQYIRQSRFKKKIVEENILKQFFKVGERDGELNAHRYLNELASNYKYDVKIIKKGIRNLIRTKLVEQKGNAFRLTSKGVSRSKQIIRLHRLWELYLSQYMNIPEDHVHEGADAIEHIITPEIEAKLEEFLNFPTEDPHGSKIPKAL